MKGREGERKVEWVEAPHEMEMQRAGRRGGGGAEGE